MIGNGGTGERGSRVYACARASVTARVCVREETYRSPVPVIPREIFSNFLNGLWGDQQGNAGICNRSPAGVGVKNRVFIR